jgi:hypothetical protein
VPIINIPLGPELRLPIVNSSGIAHNLAKIAAIPPGWHETDGYKEHFLRDETVAVRYFRGPWHEREAFFAWAIGFADIVQVNVLQPPGGPGGLVNNQIGAYLSRIPPAQHPEYPWMYATNVELIRGEGAYRDDARAIVQLGNGLPAPNPAAGGEPLTQPMIEYFDSGTNSGNLSSLVAVTYRNLDYEVRADAELAALPTAQGELERNVIREPDGSASFLPLPTGTIAFVKQDPNGNPKPPAEVVAGAIIPDVASNIVLFQEELAYTWVDVPDVDWLGISLCVGKVNDATFDGAKGWPSYKPGTLLCMGPKRRRHRTALGRVVWDITYRFLFKKDGWNYLPASNGTFWQVAFVKDGSPPYRTADFNSLFRAPTRQQYQ